MKKLIVRGGANGLAELWTEDGEECATDRTFNGWSDTLAREHNSHAALLEELYEALPMVEAQLDDDVYKPEYVKAVAGRIRAAIALATGQDGDA